MRHLKPIDYNGRPLEKFSRGVSRFVDEINTQPIPYELHIIHKEYRLPLNKELSKNKHYNILYIIAKLCKVKLMWRMVLDREKFIAIKALWIIGEPHYVFLCKKLLDHFFRTYHGYYIWICNNKKEVSKRAGYKNVRSYASKQVDLLEDTTYFVISKKLETDRKHEIWLEDHIKVQFKLDYKDYLTDKPEYYHAISEYFFHKRMVL